MAVKLTVPERAFDVLRLVGSASVGANKKLQDLLAGTPSIASPNELIALLTTAFDDALDREQAQALVTEIFSIAHAVREHDHTAESAADDISAFQPLDLKRAQREALAATIRALLKSETVLALANAVSIYTAHDRLFLEAQMYVDIRPVFDVRHERSVGSVITRKLRLSYYEDDEFKSVEVAFQDSGLTELIGALEIGRKEAGITAEHLAANGTTVFTFETGVDGDE